MLTEHPLRPQNVQQPPLGAAYRVFGVRRDKSRAMLGDRMKLDHAQRLRDLLTASNVFTSAEIESDVQSAPSLDLRS